jgi:hypothetical protein
MALQSFGVKRVFSKIMCTGGMSRSSQAKTYANESPNLSSEPVVSFLRRAKLTPSGADTGVLVAGAGTAVERYARIDKILLDNADPQ